MFISALLKNFVQLGLSSNDLFKSFNAFKLYLQHKQKYQLYKNRMSVMDSVDKYRHGVLIGNFVEDKFGRDLHEKGPFPDAQKLPTTKDHHDIYHSLYRPHEIISKKEPATNTFYQTSKNISQTNYKRPEGQTSYHIFHRRQVTPHIPILQNFAKKEERFAQQGKLYGDTRYHLSNKFIPGDGISNNSGFGQTQYDNQINRQNLRQTGNINDIEGQQIPDILTGEIYKAAQKRPDAQVYQPDKKEGEPAIKITSKVVPQTINPYATGNIIKPDVAKFDEQMYKRYVIANDKGQQRDILLGHGLEINQFHRRQLATTYDLSYNQKVMPQTQVNSFYNVDPTQTAKKFHRETFYEKNHQDRIPEYGTKTILGQQKLGRPYDPYTKTFDLKHMKDQYLRK